MTMMLRLAVLVGLMITLVTAQVGPVIISPASNATVTPGKKLNIEYQYPNMGAGDYKINIDLWQDASSTQLISNLASNVSIPPGNSTGVNLKTNLSSSYEVTLPNNLNFTFYLTITQLTQTTGGLGSFGVSSFPVMLHSAAMTHLPQSLSLLLAIALGVLGFTFF
ncbi:unnamed protein product [Cunninghamella blakesleeana]